MATGSIALTFETPDMNLTGSGEFDISSYFNTLFTENASIKNELADKITAIFNKIKVKETADDWSEKIKKGFNLKEGSIDLKESIQEKAEKAIEKLKIDIDPIFLKSSELSEKLKNSFEIKKGSLSNFNELLQVKAEKAIKALKIDMGGIGINKITLNIKNSIQEKVNEAIDSLKISVDNTTSNTSKTSSTSDAYMDYISKDVYYKNYIKFHGSKPYIDFILYYNKPEYKNYITNFVKGITELGNSFKKLSETNLDSIKLFESIIKPRKVKDEETEETDKIDKSKAVDTAPTSLESKDTAFDYALDVRVTDFTDEALEKLGAIEGGGKSKLSKRQEFGKALTEDGSGIGGMLGQLIMGQGLSTILSNMVWGGLTKLLGKYGIGGIARGLGIAGALVAGIVWVAIDGIKGYFASEEWGVSKLSGTVGSILGGMDKGISGAFKNAGKWGLLGATLGSVVPGVGTLIGGIIGSIIGAILGFFGGEKLAKGMDVIGGGLSNMWDWIKDKINGATEESEESSSVSSDATNNKFLKSIKTQSLLENKDTTPKILSDIIPTINEMFKTNSTERAQWDWNEKLERIKRREILKSGTYIDKDNNDQKQAERINKLIDMGLSKEQAEKQYETETGISVKKINDSVSNVGEVLAMITKSGITVPSPEDTTISTKTPEDLLTPNIENNDIKINMEISKMSKKLEMGLETISKTLYTILTVNREHSQVFNEIRDNSDQELKILPALIPSTPENNSVFPSSDTRDIIYDYRNDRRYSLMKGLV